MRNSREVRKSQESGLRGGIVLHAVGGDSSKVTERLRDAIRVVHQEDESARDVQRRPGRKDRWPIATSSRDARLG